jgi:MYXO-CTERM domain-containing protein
MEAMSASLRFVARKSVFAMAGAVLVGGTCAFAGTVPDTGISMDWNYGTGNTNTYTIHNADTWGINGGNLWMEGTDTQTDWTLDWRMETVAPGIRGGSEFVIANIAVFNNTMSTQTYWMLQTKPVNVGPTTDTNGSVSATLQDITGNGSFMQNISSGPFTNDPVYRAYIDGVAQSALWPAGFSLNATGVGATDTDTDSFASVGGPGASSSIGVWLKFEVSPLDQVTMQGYFEVTPAPAPAVLPLLGMMGLVARRRRSS